MEALTCSDQVVPKYLFKPSRTEPMCLTEFSRKVSVIFVLEDFRSGVILYMRDFFLKIF